MMTLRDRLKKLQAMVDALTLRERLMLFVAALVVVGGLWEALLAGPLDARETLARQQIEAAKDRLAQIDESIALAAQGIGGGLSGQVERIRALENQVAEGEQAIRVFTSDLVDPSQMRYVLEELIDRQQGLRLTRASNLPVRPLIDRDEDGDTAAANSGEPMLYRHGLRLELEGSYLDCLEYLEAVERLPWQLFWGALEVEIDEYPRNEITLEIYTLSLDEEWIGV
ncbi:MAG: hypothetical protein R3305_05330 [Gammaproteobacteria bacterium]|nr:hypothetical protein [Gammaproteobacteria bacterium]